MTDTYTQYAERPCHIARRVRDYIKQGDLDGVVSLFHPQCQIIMDPTQDPIKGHAGVREIFTDFVQKRVDLHAVVTGEMVIGDIALLQGHWKITDATGATMMKGVSTEVARKMPHGGWVYFIDCPVGMPKPEEVLKKAAG